MVQSIAYITKQEQIIKQKTAGSLNHLNCWRFVMLQVNFDYEVMRVGGGGHRPIVVGKFFPSVLLALYK